MQAGRSLAMVKPGHGMGFSRACFGHRRGFVCMAMSDLPSPTSDVEAAQKIAAIGDAMGAVAHDLNNVMAAIMGSVTLIEMRAGDITRHTQNITTATQRGTQLLRQLLALSPRLDGPFELHTPESLLEDLKAPAADLLGHAHPLSVFAPPGLGAIQVDRPQVLRALLALVENARDAMPNGGTILVTAQPVGEDRLGFSVHDHGAGIPEAVRPRIFEPFFTTKPKGKGSGLGLAIVFRIVQRHRGEVLVRSEPGQGSVFTCLFPRPTAAGP